MPSELGAVGRSPPGVKNAIIARRTHTLRRFTAAIRPESDMPRLPTRLCVLALLPIALACQADAKVPDANGKVADSGASSGAMASAPAGASKTDPAIDSTVVAVTNDVRTLQKASPEAAVAKLPEHEQLVNGMLTTFESRIRAMHVQADPAWVSVIDSVRTDLARLPAMKPDALHGFLPQHLNRVMRIVACIQMVKG